MSDDETIKQSANQFQMLGHMENFNVEASALHRKLQSKTDALRIMRKDLERFRTERDQFKLMAETLQLRYSTIKKSNDYCGNKSSVANLLHETRERNIKLTTEVETLKSKLNEMQGDIELLREAQTPKDKSKNGICKCKLTQQAKDYAEWQNERANFICNLEHLKKKNAQLAFDFKSLIDEKQELTMERDAYKCKAHRLNHELLAALKANEKHSKFLDVDSVLLENKYLRECLKSCENDLDLTKQSMCKYKTMLETKRKKGIMKLGSSSNDESILSHKQVKSLLESGIELPTKTETIQDLKSLCLTLLDSLNDKNLALNHQKKANKLLGTKIAELEQRIQMLSGIDTSSMSSGYSPSQFLLEGYCPSLVDSNETATDATTTATTDIENIETAKTANTNNTTHASTTNEECRQATSCSYSDDGTSFSTESARSVLSSEYGGIINGLNNTSFNSDAPRVSTLNDFANNALLSYRTPATTTTSTSDSGLLHCFSANSHGSSLISSAIEEERKNDLKDLPADLAALVQKALHELDMREFETKVVIKNTKLTLPKEEEGALNETLTVEDSTMVANETAEFAQKNDFVENSDLDDEA